MAPFPSPNKVINCNGILNQEEAEGEGEGEGEERWNGDPGLKEARWRQEGRIWRETLWLPDLDVSSASAGVWELLLPSPRTPLLRRGLFVCPWDLTEWRIRADKHWGDPLFSLPTNLLPPSLPATPTPRRPSRGREGRPRPCTGHTRRLLHLPAQPFIIVSPVTSFSSFTWHYDVCFQPFVIILGLLPATLHQLQKKNPYNYRA